VTWNLSYRPGGWVRLQSREDEDTRVYVQLDFSDARPEIRKAMMTSRSRISARSWRHVPFDAIEVQGLMTIGGLDEILRRPNDVVASPEALEQYFEATAEEYGSYSGFQIGDHVVGPFHDADGQPAAQPFVHVRALEAPERPIPDEFYEELAKVYEGFVGNKVAPAPAIAQGARVSVRTVHGWISEARRRGHLPPARRGRAG
jgi:hypothetical protein